MAVSNKINNHSKRDITNFRKKILDWYDKHQRSLPWRAVNGNIPDPYHVWLSEIMLQQTTVVTVGPYFQKFLNKWPTVHDLAKAQKEDVMHEWAGLGYYARARNLHKCAQMVSNDLGGVFPTTQKELQELSGIGDYTSAAICAIAFDKPANVVDGNIERIMARYYAVLEPVPDSKGHLKELAGILSNGRTDRPGDYAQALMDIGSSICTPKSPKCILCPIEKGCQARKKGIAAELPAKKPKAAKPQKQGHVYWITNKKGKILFLRRNETEMLGGMLGLPTTQWNTGKKPLTPLKGRKTTKTAIYHSFTHFDLKLDIFTADYNAHDKKQHENGIIPPENSHLWVSPLDLEKLGLPTLFSKVVKVMK